jgi:hypothetical protein
MNSLRKKMRGIDLRRSSVWKLAGLDLANSSNQKLSSINELLMNKGGSIRAAVLKRRQPRHGLARRRRAYDEITLSSERSPIRRRRTPADPGAVAASAAPRPPGSTTTTGPAAPTAKPNPCYADHAVFNTTKDKLKGIYWRPMRGFRLNQSNRVEAARSCRVLFALPQWRHDARVFSAQV